MNIIIVGAGDVGQHMATLLSKQNHNVILIDKNGAKLQEISWEMDVAIRQGSGLDWQLLDEFLEMRPDLLCALTSEDEVNLVTCSLAKQLGYPRTVARVKDNRFLNRTRLDFAKLFNVDYFISPELLVAYDIYKYLMSTRSLAFENFAHGALQMRMLRIPLTWKQQHQKIKDLKLPQGIIVGLIRRPQLGQQPTIIFPHGSDYILAGDEITFIGQKAVIASIHSFFDIQISPLKSVIIVGGSLVGLNLAKILENQHMHIRLIEKNHDRCLALARELPHCEVIHHEGIDLNFLQSEKINQHDFFICCTHSDELNVLGALVAKEIGCQHVAVVLANDRFVPLVQRLGIGHVLSPKLAAAQFILSLTYSQAITSLVNLYDHQVEIIEMTVSLNSKIVGIPLANLGQELPKNFLIAMIQSRGLVTIAHGTSVICPGDTVIVICAPQHIAELEKFFK